ncbi:sugar-binding domain-containing protein [Arthrobacter sp. MMS24-S77]
MGGRFRIRGRLLVRGRRGQHEDLDIRDHVGWVWYQRTVRDPRGWAVERIRVRVDAATHEGRVFVNDALVAEQIGGYTPFEADVTSLVDAGEEFRLTIGVNNELTKSTMPPGFVTVTEDGRRQQKYLHDFFNYGGLARSVWLYSVPSVAVVDGEADVRVSVRGTDGMLVAREHRATGELRIADAVLWQPGATYLYDLVVDVMDGEHIIDSYYLPVGVRTVEVRGTELLMNGEPFYFRGFGKHEDSAIVEKATTRYTWFTTSA